MTNQKKYSPTRGGKRKNAGRKNTGTTVETLVMRVPKVLKPEIDKLIKRYKESLEYKYLTSRLDVTKNQKVVIFCSFWNEKNKDYQYRYLLRQVLKVTESYFDTQGGWRFARTGIKKGRILDQVPDEYRQIVKKYGKPEHMGVEKYVSKKYKNLKFMLQ